MPIKHIAQQTCIWRGWRTVVRNVAAAHIYEHVHIRTYTYTYTYMGRNVKKSSSAPAATAKEGVSLGGKWWWLEQQQREKRSLEPRALSPRAASTLLPQNCHCTLLPLFPQRAAIAQRASTELPMEAESKPSTPVQCCCQWASTLTLQCIHCTTASTCASKCQPTQATTVCTIPRYSFLYVQIPCILLGVNEPRCRKGEELW